jgi:hypothetical protein
MAEQEARSLQANLTEGTGNPASVVRAAGGLPAKMDGD